jgi:hypothetical protein
MGTEILAIAIPCAIALVLLRVSPVFRWLVYAVAGLATLIPLIGAVLLAPRPAALTAVLFAMPGAALLGIAIMMGRAQSSAIGRSSARNPYRPPSRIEPFRYTEALDNPERYRQRQERGY